MFNDSISSTIYTNTSPICRTLICMLKGGKEHQVRKLGIRDFFKQKRDAPSEEKQSFLQEKSICIRDVQSSNSCVRANV